MSKRESLQMRPAMNKYKTAISTIISAAIIITGAAFSTGCVYMHTYATGIKDSAEPIENNQYNILNPVYGQSSSFRLFWFIPVTPRINYNEAVDEAVLSGNGDNLIDVRMYEKRQIWILGTVDILYVEGKAIKYREEKPEEKAQDKE